MLSLIPITEVARRLGVSEEALQPHVDSRRLRTCGMADGSLAASEDDFLRFVWHEYLVSELGEFLDAHGVTHPTSDLPTMIRGDVLGSYVVKYGGHVIADVSVEDGNMYFKHALWSNGQLRMSLALALFRIMAVESFDRDSWLFDHVMTHDHC